MNFLSKERINMIKYENLCCDCAVPGYPCLGKFCPLRNVAVHYCDRCDMELDYINKVGDEELCDDCYEAIEGSEEDAE